MPVVRRLIIHPDPETITTAVTDTHLLPCPIYCHAAARNPHQPQQAQQEHESGRPLTQQEKQKQVSCSQCQRLPLPLPCGQETCTQGQEQEA